MKQVLINLAVNDLQKSMDFYAVLGLNRNFQTIQQSVWFGAKELKSLLHESIENIDDESFLQTVKHKYQPKEEVTLLSYQEKRIDEAKKILIREIT